jgi:hypothetical protein
MAHIALNDAGEVTAYFLAPQPDAVDENGNVICKGTPTIEVGDDDPRVVAYLSALPKGVQ